MANVRLVKWGNSVGIRLPADILKATDFHVGEEINLQVNPKNGTVTLTPVTNPQTGWEEAFNAMADTDADQMLIDDHLDNDFDEDDWKW